MRTLRALLYVLTAAVTSALWFGLLVAAAVVLPLAAFTPLLVPALMAYRALVWSCARLEAALLRDVLGVPVDVPPARYGDKGYLGRVRGIFGDAAFWREQTFLALRMLVGGTLAVVVISAFGSSLWMVGAPIWYRWNGEDFLWRVDSFVRALPVVPIGLVALGVSLLILRAAASIWPPLGRLLLEGRPAAPRATAGPTPVAQALRRALPAHAAFYVLLNVLLTIVWAVTTRAYFWPEWPVLSLGLLLAIHAWTVAVQDPRLGPRLRLTPALAIHAGAAFALWIFLVCVWAVTTAGYFWPMWPLLGFVVLLGGHALTVLAAARDRAQLTERIEVLTTTRTGAVDAAESELRRIERNLHDGAQARLVALGMSIGMAEQKLASDPEGARRLLAEARVGAGEALRELRDLARGIHPPILTDRGLEAALASLVARSPLPVALRVDVAERPPEPVEAAAYFVVAEALANAVKHAAASSVEIDVVRAADVLTVSVVDDGRGGADPDGSGLSGIRRRVEALDGTLRVESPAGGPTRLEAMLPCVS